MKNIGKCFVGLVAILGTGLCYASVIIPMYLTAENGAGKAVGTIKAEDTARGLLLTPDLKDLPPGDHGFHVHAMPMCDHKGMAAGAHFDPENAGKHLGPNGKGHLGDLPVLVVDAKGDATTPVVAPRLKEKDIAGHALMIHAGGDNYSDTPEKLGGGGARLACGVVPAH